jgi:glycosyltransferase involved in cell wall biosynthesis
MSKNTLHDIVIVIPSLKPDEKLIKLIDTLTLSGCRQIIVVNDGSPPEYDPIFQALPQDTVKTLRHAVNQGKGRALKTAFHEILLQPEYAACRGVITVDSDGQHSVKDILHCAEALTRHPECLIMGYRNFSHANIPLRSKLGNLITRKIMALLCGIYISDTQTGLRGFSHETMKLFLSSPGEGYEYETQLLLTAKEHYIDILDVPIETIYIDHNRSSHFNPLWDSLRIYKLFLKYLVSSLSCFLLDIGLFSLLVFLLRASPALAPFGSAAYIFISTLLARTISAIVNYFLNQRKVFGNPHTQNAPLKYFALSIFVMVTSSLSVTLLYALFSFIHESVIKIVVDSILFFFSFMVQRDWVFAKGKRG